MNQHLEHTLGIGRDIKDDTRDSRWMQEARVQYGKLKAGIGLLVRYRKAEYDGVGLIAAILSREDAGRKAERRGAIMFS